MALLSRQICQFSAQILIFVLLNVQLSEESSSWYSLDENSPRIGYDDIVLLHSNRIRREVDELLSSHTNTPTSPSLHSTTPVTLTPSSNAVTNKTVADATATATATPAKPVDFSTRQPSSTTLIAPPTVTQTMPNVGVNGSGIRKDIMVPKVSDPIVSEDVDNNTVSKTDVAKIMTDIPEMVGPETALDNLTKTDHEYYHSTFIGEQAFFKDHWENITKMHYEVHPILSSSHRRATMVNLNFDFPFYGQQLRNVTVATGGFIYTGDHVHNWLAATQYIAPLMANFDTRATNDSAVKIADDGNNFTVIWENVTLQDYINKSFTFAVTLRKDGDIIFAYKDIPIPVQYIEDKEHPVKVGISDAYQNDRVIFYKKRKTIYEYHRVNLLDHNITGGTILRLHAKPTCLLFDTCADCINHNTTFNCSWCPALERCSSGIDRKKQDWLLRNCDKIQTTKLEECPATQLNDSNIKTDYTSPLKNTAVPDHRKDTLTSTVAGHSSLGGVVVLFFTLALLVFGSGWVYYAYKNPHTRSGQLLIKYRPSTWNWKRGEARYTAATIHM